MGQWVAGEFVAGPVGTLAAGGGSWQDGKWVSGPIEVLGAGGVPADGSITAAMLATDSVTNVKIADAAVGGSNIADGAVVSAKIGNSAVTLAKLGSDATTALNGKTAKASFAALTALADPATATSVQIATLLNAVLAAAKV